MHKQAVQTDMQQERVATAALFNTIALLKPLLAVQAPFCCCWR
jgi:hypothetical protein